MTRDESIALLAACEEKRTAAFEAALKEGTADYSAHGPAHEAAKAHWNTWAEALLAERRELEEKGLWATETGNVFNLFQQGAKNDETNDWLKRAELDFSRCLLKMRVEGDDKAQAEDDEMHEHTIVFQGLTIDFSGFIFPGRASFGSATFENTVTFRGATFVEGCDFVFAKFKSVANFDLAGFCDDAVFGHATFEDEAFFNGTTYAGSASFGSATFKSRALFGGAEFSGGAHFFQTSFVNSVSFRQTNFNSSVKFAGATFGDYPDFNSANFTDHADFEGANFTRRAYFGGVDFTGRADFMNATFTEEVKFNNASFKDDGNFTGAIFKNTMTFIEASFEAKADFTAIKVERGFNMTGASFNQVPAFNQADFKQPPDLDNVRFPLPGFLRSGSANLIAQYRAIRRMAIQGADYEREQMAFKGEIRSKRWTENRWYHAGRWFGMFYDAFSDFGRSLWRPLVVWLACIGVFAVYFLGESPQMVAKRKEMHLSGPLGQIVSFSTAAFGAAKKASVSYCYPHTKPAPGKTTQVPDGFSGLVEEARATTNLVNEALSIAYHNAVVILDSSGDSAHRAFGCLYGVERYGGNPVAFVPRSIAIASGIQKLLSAIFIFLFILAVRNMLRVK